MSVAFQSLLFVRDGKATASDSTESFRYIGPITYFRHEGSCPMSIVRKLHCLLLVSEPRSYRRDVL
jgi:hypothetical protein